jgi:hypothetical protein
MKGVSAIAAIIVILLIGVLVVTFGGFKFPTTGQIPGLTVSPTAVDNCPDDGDSTFKLQVFNELNTTDAENYDMTIVCKGSDGSSYTITDTTSPSGVTVNCGYDYVCYGVSTTGAGGDHAKFIKVRSGTSSTKIEDGLLKFRADRPNIIIDVGSTQHGVLEARAYSIDEAGFMYADTDTSAGSWHTTGSVFGNATKNSTTGAITVGSGGKFKVRLDVRVNANTDEQFEDYGWYLFIDAASNKWDDPAIKIEGTTYTSDCSVLNSDESKAYSGEEYCYLVTGIPITNNDDIEVEFTFNALSGVNPGTSDDINVTFASIGAYQSTTDSTNVLRGAVKDDSSQTQVFAIAEWQFAVQ